MEKIKNNIKRNLRMQGKTQSDIADILKITQSAVSLKISGARKWEDWELEELKLNGIYNEL